MTRTKSWFRTSWGGSAPGFIGQGAGRVLASRSRCARDRIFTKDSQQNGTLQHSTDTGASL